MASPPLTGTIASINPACTTSAVSFGMKSGDHPCIRWGRKLGWLPDAGWAMPLPSSWALSGSQTMIRISGRALFSTRDTPFRVPPVPKPVTQ